MAVSPHLEKVFFHNIIKHSHYVEHVNSKFFDNQILRKLFPIVKDFVTKYKQPPTRAQLEEILKVKEMDRDINADQLAATWEIETDEFEETWLKENTETFIELKTLDNSVIDIVEYFKVTPINPDNIKLVIQKVKNTINSKNNLNFDFNEGSDFYDPDSHRQPTYNTFSTGFPFIDQVADGGLSAKTLTVFLGMPKVGKSIWLANMAAKAVLAGHHVAVITLEMGEAKYIKRIGANLLNITMDEYKNAARDSGFIKDKLKNLSANGGLNIPGRLVVKEFPTSTASSVDIESFLTRYEEKHGIKFKVVIIDYLNIMKNWRNANTENTYMKIKQIAEDVRAMAQSNEWAVVSVSQVNKNFFDSNDMNISAAAESSALVATVDLMFGIIRDPKMLMESKYKLKVLANRDEGFTNYHKMFDIDYKHMRLTEDSTPMAETLFEPQMKVAQGFKPRQN